MSIRLDFMNIEHLASLRHLDLGALDRSLAWVRCLEDVLEVLKGLACSFNEEAM
jgi:hypothetical protein